jgi:hypothetical protein
MSNDTLSTMGDNELRMRRGMVNMCIRVCRQEKNQDAEAFYRAQAEEIDTELRRRRWLNPGWSKPEEVGVELKPGTLGAITPK